MLSQKREANNVQELDCGFEYDKLMCEENCEKYNFDIGLDDLDCGYELDKALGEVQGE